MKTNNEIGIEKCLGVAKALAEDGIFFVPMPMLGGEDKTKLFEEMNRRLKHINDSREKGIRLHLIDK